LTPEQDDRSLVIDHLEPEVADLEGYRLRRRDLKFLLIEPADYEAWHSRARPLGLSQIQYEGLLQDLSEALLRDGVPLDVCDVRLKGSAAHFFSGAHKLMPVTRDDIVDAFEAMRSRYPANWEIMDIEHRLHEVWITDGDRPTQRPFDSFHRIGIDRERSDIDLQISSDALTTRCESLLRKAGQSLTEVRMKHPVYNFVKKPLVEREFPQLFLFTRRMADALDRNVNVAVFPSAGPPDVSATHPELSAHHTTHDWVVTLEPPTSTEALG